MKMLVLSAPAVLAGAIALFQMPTTPPMKMGLWEIDTTTKMVIPDMPAGMPMMGPRNIKLHACLTPESYQKYMVQAQQSKDCTRSNEMWADGHYSADISCNGGKMTGHSEMTMDSKEEAHGTAHMQMNQGKGMTADTNVHMKWLAVECGAVTPEKPQMVK